MPLFRWRVNVEADADLQPGVPGLEEETPAASDRAATMVPEEAFSLPCPTEHPFGREMDDAAPAFAFEDPTLVYECATTGCIITEANLEFLTEEEVAEWNDAIEKHFVEDKSPS